MLVDAVVGAVARAAVQSRTHYSKPSALIALVARCESGGGLYTQKPTPAVGYTDEYLAGDRNRRYQRLWAVGVELTSAGRYPVYRRLMCRQNLIVSTRYGITSTRPTHAEQPYCRIANVVAAGIAKRQTASEYLARLTEIGVLTSIQFGREKLFIHRALLDLLASETHEAPPYG